MDDFGQRHGLAAVTDRTRGIITGCALREYRIRFYSIAGRYGTLEIGLRTVVLREKY